MFATRNLSKSSRGGQIVDRGDAAYGPSPIDSSTHRLKQIVLWMSIIPLPKVFRHGRACPGHPRLGRKIKKDVDARDKPGHDELSYPVPVQSTRMIQPKSKHQVRTAPAVQFAQKPPACSARQDNGGSMAL
jgi:hypothetical protein